MSSTDPNQKSAQATGKRVLVVDDEPDIRELLVLTLMRMGIEADTAATCQHAFARLAEREYSLALTDMRLPDGDGLSVLEHIAKHHGNTPVAVITAFGSTDNAVAALKAGAFDYIAKPIQLKQVREVITAALSLPRAPGAAWGERSKRSAPEKPAGGATNTTTGPRLLGESAPIVKARELIGKLSRSQAAVHISGESGTGKEVAARLIHADSARRDAAFVAVNCGAIPENLMESEFFGYRKGAFTGADTDRDGVLQAADGGTLFLDEVGDLPLAMQVKLLRVIQEKRVRKLGETAEKPIDFRIISATHKNLAEKVEAGEFRQDLFYRLNVIGLKMPSLREIPEDIPTMVKQMMQRLGGAAGGVDGAAMPLSDAAMRALADYDFPGNVRELENILERAVALCDGGVIEVEDLYLADGRGDSRLSAASVDGNRSEPLHEYLDRLERDQIVRALEQTKHNKTAAAKVLGISFRSLRYRLDRLGID